MENFDKNNPYNDDHKSVSAQDADSITASDPGNLNLVNQQEGVKSDTVMHPCIQPNPVVLASPTNDGASSSGTLDKSDSKKNHGGKDKSSKDSNDGASATPRNLGMIDSLVGATYQQKLSIPIVCKIAALIRKDEQLNFTITNDDEKGGLFDDIVFKSDDGDLFIQAKHKEDKSYTITWDDLISTDKKAPFSISKYLNSFVNNEWDNEKNPPVLVLCTNIGLHEDVKTSLKEYHFGTNIVDSILKSINDYAYYIDLKDETNNKLLDYLKEDSEFGTLAKLIAQHIFQKKKIEFRNDSVQTKYRSIIENEIASKKSIGHECYEVNAEIFNENSEFKRVFEHEYKLQKREQLIGYDIKEKGIKLKKVKPTEFEDKNNPKRICNSDSADLATHLAQHIYREKNIDFQITVFQKYRFVIEKFIATDKKNRKGCYVVDENNFNKVGCRDFKRLFNMEYQNLLKPEPLDIWSDVQNKGIRLKKEKQPNSSDRKKELPKPLEDDQIEKFFKTYMIVCNTKHEEGQVVASILESDLLPENIREQSSAAFTFNKVGMWILDRMKDKSRTPIKRRDINELFKYIESSLNFSQLNTLSNSNCTKLLNLGLQCKREVLQEFKLYKNLHSLLAKVETDRNEKFNVDIDDYNYPSWVVLQIIQSIDSKLDFLFLEDTEFESRKKQIMNAFGAMKSPLILVIECKSSPNFKGYIEGRVENMSTRTIKKIILIDKTYNATEIERDLLVRDLIDKSREQIINQTKIVNFFGTETSTSKLIHDEDKLDFVLHVLQLPSGTGIKSSKLKESYDKIKDTFIHRKWKQCDEKELRQTSSCRFWYTRRKDANLTKLFPGSEVENKISNKTFLDYRNSKHTHPPGVDGNIEDQGQFNIDRKVHVIFNEAGSGKSYYLTWLASYLQDKSPSSWIIKFNLNEYCNEFDQLQKRDKCEAMNAMIAIRFLFQLVYLAWLVDNMFRIDSNEKSNKAQAIAEALDFSNGRLKLDENKIKTVSSEELMLLRIFVHKFNSKQFVILMDGFDETAPDYKTVVLELLSTLKTFDEICKVFLSSRPYGLKNEVETALKNCAGYRLVEFDQGDQSSFIDRYLLKHFDEYKSSDDAKQTRTCYVFFTILREFLGDLMEIPLFLSMGIDLLMPMVKKYKSLEEDILFKKIIKDCESIFEPLSMVESFVEKKLDIMGLEKTGSTITSSKTVVAITNAKQKLDQVKETHSLLALYTLMNEDDINELLTIDTQNIARRYMENVKNGLEKSGLIEGVVHNKPIFIHRVFAEYFTAFWFYMNQNVRGVKGFLKCKMYETYRTIEVKKFLDRMICSKSSLHMAVLDGSKGKIKRILIDNPNLITARDDWGRTPLHLLVSLSPSKGHRKMVQFLLHWIDENNANIQDTYFEWFPLNYAYCADIENARSYRVDSDSFDRPGWHYVVRLLNKGASIDTPEMLSRFSTKENLIMVLDMLIIEFRTEKNYTPNFESFFTILVQNLGLDKVLNLKIPIDANCFNPVFSIEKMGKKLFTKINQTIKKKVKEIPRTVPILKFCIMIDSVLTKIIIENSNDFNLKQLHEYFMLALKCRSINVLHYLITNHRQYLNEIEDNFERELWELLAYLQSDEQEFNSLFHEYCTRHNVTCQEGTPLQTHSPIQSMNWNRGFSLQHGIMENYPKKFEIRDDTGIDSGTEFLIARAMEIDNASAVEYLLHKSKTNLDNRFIRQICMNCKINWYCLSSYHFLLDKIDLNDTDEKGRNLLHFAAVYGDFNLVKCLMEHYSFQPKEINTREHNWNAFFYCVSSCERSANRKYIFNHMLEKDPVDCFNQLDAQGKNVFYYATKNNKNISYFIIHKKIGRQLEFLNSVQIVDSMKFLKASGLNTKDTLEYLPKKICKDETKCKLVCDTLESIGGLRNHDENGRNLLHIAVVKGWFVLGKCLIEDYSFDVKEINENENNWNAFSYCVSACKENFDENRERFFFYMMEKDPVDLFEQRYANLKSLFDYVYDIDKNFAKQMFKLEWDKLRHLSIEQRVPALFGKLQKSDISLGKTLEYFEENHLIDEETAKIICKYLKSTKELNYREEETNRSLLHIACMEGLLTLAKCLIKHYGFDMKEINEQEYNWNAFFYCVFNSKNASKKLEIFTYFMEKHPFDCFGQLDSKGKSIFWYATFYNKVIGNNIFKRECKLQEHLPIEMRIPVLMDKLKSSCLKSLGKILKFEQNNLVDEKSVEIICDYLNTTGELNWKCNKRSRNLLHIACMNGWLILTKCLVEHYGPLHKAKEINVKDNNWNAFFYCVNNSENVSKKLEIFTYLMEKDPFDCFGQLDSENHNVFYYALLYNGFVADYIIGNEFFANNSVSVIERATMFSKCLSESELPRTEIDRFLIDWKQFSTLDAKHEIYNEIQANLERMN